MKSAKLQNIGIAFTGATMAIFLAVTWLNSSWLMILISQVITSLVAIIATTFVIGGALLARLWYLKRRAELRRDTDLATNEARQSNIQSDRVEMNLMYEGRLMAAQIRQVENGMVHLSQIDQVKFASFPASIIKEIENEVPLLEAPKTLPSRIELSQLLTEKPSLNNLILGVTEGDEIVRDSLKSLTHVAIGGSTRWGKSIFLQMLLYQIALAREETKLYLADLGGTTFVDFGLPYASTLGEVESMVIQVMNETEARKDLYKATGRGIKSLDMYNSITGDNLPHIVMAIDEALYLMERSKTVKENLEIAVSWAAKYGVTCLMVSQDWKASVISTGTRNNFSSRFQFLAEDKTQSNILISGSEAHKIENQGRCFSRLPGNRKIIELQTPFVSENEIMAIAPHIQERGAFGPMVDTSPLTYVVTDPDKPTDEEMAAIETFVSVRDSGNFSWRKATEATYGKGKFGKGPNEKLRATLDKFNVDYSEYISQ
jgi:hypothetical protein